MHSPAGCYPRAMDTTAEKADLRATRGVGLVKANVYLATEDQVIYGELSAKTGDLVISINDFFSDEAVSANVNGVDVEEDQVATFSGNKIFGSSLLTAGYYAVVPIAPPAPPEDGQDPEPLKITVVLTWNSQEQTQEVRVDNNPIGFLWF